MRIGSECGRPWYRFGSWLCWHDGQVHYSGKDLFRRFPGGFAVGPIMIVKGKW